MRHRVIKGAVLCIAVFTSSIAWGAYPLITDDAETQGTGKAQVEFNSEFDWDKQTVDGVTAESTGGQVLTILSYGVAENADLVLTLPYQWAKVKEEGVTVYDEKGISDTTLDVKWRFFEKGGLMLAVKPGVIVPTGNESRGLGAGKIGYHAFLIGTKEAEPWEFHGNVGYIRNENKVNEEENIWHFSFAAGYEVFKNLEFVGNIGIERNPDKTASGNPAFLLGGVIYEVSEDLTVDCGVKYGLTAAETDWSLMAGMAYRF